MMKAKLALAIVALVAAATLAVAAASKSISGPAAHPLTKCVPTADGKFICKEIGAVMDEPCCVKRCGK